MRTEPATMCARILTEKYCHRRGWENPTRKTTSISNAWRGIQETTPFTDKGMGFTVGDGRHTNFWNHVWLDKVILREHGRCPIPEEHLNWRVCDYWSITHGWDWATLSTFLPVDILHRLASIDLTEEEVGDRIVWKASKTGAFTLQSAIQLLQGVESDTAVKWSAIWKLRIPNRIRFFVWLLYHGRLLTNAERFRRSLSSTPQCDLCPGEVEDSQHLFRDCPHAQQIWSSLSEKGFCCVANGADFPNWLQLNLAGSHHDSKWPTKFAISLWYLWKWRCSYCHNEPGKISTDTTEFLIHKFQEILQALDMGKSSVRPTRVEPVEQSIAWELPP